jgi:CHAT domain-containing protein/Tfp pilus assembly protein PilF
MAQSDEPLRTVTPLQASVEVQRLLELAKQANTTGKNDEAAVLYEQALSRARELKDRKGEVDALRGRGYVYLATGHPQESLEWQQQSLAAARAIGDKTGEGGALANIGSVYVSTGQPQKALEFYQQAVPILRAAGQSQYEANALYGIGTIDFSSGQFQKALECFQQALPLYRAVGDKHWEAHTLQNIGDVYDNVSELQKALNFFRQALPIFRALGDRAGEGGVLADIGIVYFNIGEPQKALERFRQAQQLRRAVSDKHWEADTLQHIGNVYKDTGQPHKALEFYRQALPIFRALGDKTDEGGTLVNIGIVYGNLGEPRRALEYYQQALPILRDIGDKAHEGGALVNIGNVYSDTGQVQKALEFYQQALPIVRAAGQRQFEANTLNSIGIAYYSSAQPERALEFYRQALPILRAIGDKAGVGGTLVNIGNIYSDAGQAQQALDYYQQALPILRAEGQHHFEAIALNAIGQVYTRTGQAQKALESYRQARPILHDLGDRDREARALQGIGYIYETTGRPQKALTFYQQARAIVERFRADLGAYSEAKSRYFQSKLPLYYRALCLQLRLHQYAGAFDLAQQTKARNLLDLMASGRIDLARDLTAEEHQQLDQLRRQADLLNQQMVKEGIENQVGAKQRFAALQMQLRHTEEQLQTLTDTLYARHPALAAKCVAATATLTQVAASLPADTALLEYAVTSGSEVTLFVVRRRQGKAEERVFSLHLGYDRLCKDAAAFRKACADPRSSYHELARQLYRQLLAPAQATLTGVKRLVICPDQALWDVPFAALMPDDRTFVADRITLSYAYSATGLLAAKALHVQAHRARPTGTLLALANPEFGAVSRFGDLKEVAGQRPFDAPSRPFDVPSRPFDVPSRPMDVPSRPFDAPSRTLPTLVRGNHIASLPGTQQEADALAKLFPDAAIFTGDKAQEAVVKSEGGKYRYLHFATHGFCNDADPMLSAIVLAAPPKDSHDDGFLTAREIAELKLNAELVVLSACNTARGEERSGEGVIGLSWALLVAGCPSEVVSQWSVDDASTATLMADFYVRLKAGEGKGTALAAAAGQLRSGAKYRHPYYWAPFILIGDWR